MMPSRRQAELVVATMVVIFVALTIEAHAFFGAKFEPQDGMIYHCAQAEVRPKNQEEYNVDWPGTSEYAAACGHQPKLIMHYISFDDRAIRLLEPTIRGIARKSHDYWPQIGLDFYRYGQPGHILKPIDITEDIAKGKYDGKIHRLATMFKQMKIPCFLRPGYEFGGNGQGRFASKIYWIQAWKRIYDIFQERKAHNVAFVWSALDARDFMDYYPGDAYVDWWAINVFVNNADQNQFINYFIQRAATHQKPVMIAESTPRYIGSVGGEASWNTWYQPYFNLAFKYPHVKAFCYINASWKGYPDPTFAYDCRIQRSSYVAARYREVMSNRSIIHAIKRSTH
ncbi:MAG: Beta-1,3-xylanase TXYA precursor [Syntrophorhabdus sp. PtaU1.Bin002]|nr:MAG: Beta-1,3-xylanase TXYA precursor [Syntrophorhabdus sp. PtaB.Bin006]OPY71477.1 MAG: Beta-1,3-xylanase TXYA precursor [Syntrophorhabdus sp. PtaU1.Bin002]